MATKTLTELLQALRTAERRWELPAASSDVRESALEVIALGPSIRTPPCRRIALSSCSSTTKGGTWPPLEGSLASSAMTHTTPLVARSRTSPRRTWRPKHHRSGPRSWPPAGRMARSVCRELRVRWWPCATRREHTIRSPAITSPASGRPRMNSRADRTSAERDPFSPPDEPS